MSGFTLRAIDFVYKQPLLTHTARGPQQPLLLMFGDTAKRATGTYINKDEVARLLEFIYTEVYPEGYSVDSEETTRYKELCSRLKDELIGRLPARLEMLTLGQLVQQTQNLRRSRLG